MPRDDDIPRKSGQSEQEQIESVILHIVVERRKIATDDLLAEAVWKPGDEREVQTAKRAIDSLREYGLLMPERDDGVLEPTPAAVKSIALRV